MDTLFIENLIFKGIHGLTGRERLDHQRFALDIRVETDTEEAIVSDNLAHTFDYKEAREIAKRVVEGSSRVLIETLADQIAREICEYRSVFSATVTIRKLDAHDSGTPGITLTRKRLPSRQERLLKHFDTDSTLARLTQDGAVSIPILEESFRARLVGEAKILPYKEQPRVVPPYNVQEEISITFDIPSGSALLQLKENFEAVIREKFGRCFIPPFTFNDVCLQRYDTGSIGVTPHRDGKSMINIIAIFILCGKAKYALCDNREGLNPRYLDTTPGNVILMQAPGFLGSDARPFHCVTDVEEERIIFCLRQKKL